MLHKFIIAAAVLAAASPACAQVASSPQAPPPHAAAPRAGRAVVEDVRKVVRENYVVRERRPAIDAVLVKGIAAGRYDGVGPAELAQRVTDDM